MTSPIEKSNTPPCTNYESTIANETISVEGSVGSIQLRVEAYKLTYGPVIEIRISVDKQCIGSEHPFILINPFKIEKGKVEDIIDDTPAIRGIINELVQKKKFKLYSTSDCIHRAALIRSLTLFWS